MSDTSLSISDIKPSDSERISSASEMSPSDNETGPLNSETGPLNHFDGEGRAIMVDVADKAVTDRAAVAKGRIRMRPATLALIEAGQAAKGDVLGVARVAGIMAAKRAWELIPLCHQLPLCHCGIEFYADGERSEIEAACSVRVTGRTGAEMEALTGAATALLTIYDMCKAVDREMEIHSLCLHEKSGGKSGHYRREVSARAE
jgi:cyclic pyranopterin phosphate synthase